jgi:hypothetical protein
MDELQPPTGRKIALALKLLRQAYGETGLLLYELDSFMREHGWLPMYGNRTTRDVTSSLQNPSYWLLQGTFRYYQKEAPQTPEEPTSRLGITIVWWQDELSNDLDPFVIFGRTDGLEKDMEHWDLWKAWFQGEHPEQIGGDEIIGEIESVSFRVSTCFLTTIANKQDIASLGKQLLDSSELV